MDEQLTRELPHSIEVDRNAKGEMSWKIKIYFEESQEWSDVVTSLGNIDNALRERFLPKPDTAAQLEASIAKLRNGRES